MKADLIYALMSFLDGITIFLFAFGCFAVSIRDYWKEILVTNMIISTGTFFLRSNETLSYVIPVICFVLLIASLTFYFRIRLWSSAKLAVYGFAAQFVSQMIMAVVFMIFSGFAYSETLNKLGTYIQLTGDVALIVLTVVLQKRKIWYTTMPYDFTYKIKLTKINVISLIIGFFVVILLYNIKQIDNVFIGLMFWLICLINLIFVDVYKEKSVTI